MRCRRYACRGSIGFKVLRKVIEDDEVSILPNRFLVRVRPFFVETGVMGRMIRELEGHGFILKAVRTPERYDHLTEYRFERRVGMPQLERGSAGAVVSPLEGGR